MCAIAGFMSLASTFPECADKLLDRMLTCMKHRGPDGFGQHIDTANSLAFGQARLAIIDLTDGGQQPFLSQDGTVSVVFNGEIYNYRQLAQELAELGKHMRTQADTEVLVEAYCQWGINFLDRLEGMFAIALFDSKSGQMFLVRDRIGVKPLYFSLQGGMLSFASQTEAITGLPWVKLQPNPKAFYDYLTFMACPAPMTTHKGVYKLPAGHFLKIDSSKQVTYQQWYCPIEATSRKVKELASITPQEAVHQTFDIVARSVQKRLVSDVPVSVFLSGGLDSSLITALASTGTKRLSTFNVSFAGDQGSDERAWARRVSDIFGTDHHEVSVTDSQVPQLIKESRDSCDQPLGDCVNVPLLAVSKLCHSFGFKVVLVGEGSDELFFGYPEYLKHKRLSSLVSPWGRLGKLLAKPASILAARLGARDSLRALLASLADGRQPFWGAAVAFHEHEKTMLKQELAGQLEHDEVINKIVLDFNQELGSGHWIDFYMARISQHFEHPDFHRRLAFLELGNRLPELLLSRLDSINMACSLEGRVPFLDHELIEFCLALPEHIRLQGSELKPLLKQAALKVLPKELVYRKKQGFGAPLAAWLDKGFIPAKQWPQKWNAGKLTPLKRWVLESYQN